MSIKSIVNGAKWLFNLTKANPHIALAGAAVVGVVGVAYSAYKSGKKAHAMLEQAKEEKGAELNRKEKAKIIAKCSWITAVIVVLTGAAIITGTCSAHKHIRKVTAMYTTTAAMLEAHQNAELVKLGKDVVDDIKEEVGKNYDLPEKTALNTEEIGPRGVHDYLCFDDFSGRYFYSNVDKIDAAFVKVGSIMLTSMDGTATVNDLYEELGLDSCGCGASWGWDLQCDNHRINDCIPYELYPKEAPGGEPCQVLVYHPLEVVPF